MHTYILHPLAGLVLLGSIILGIAGCDSFTDIQPKGTLSGEQLSTPAGAEAVVRAAYAALDGALTSDADQIPTFLNPPSNWSYGDVRSDDAYKGGGGTGDIIEYHAAEINSGGLAATSGVIDRKWTSDFQGIQRANEAIQAVQALNEEEFPQKQQRIAEMRFLRGHFYFDLKKLFNRVPWVDETVDSEAIREISNTELTSDELWEKIVADFQFAADNLPEAAEEAGRADRYAALAYLAKVALFREQWDRVIALTGEVMGGGFDLLDRYDYLSMVETFDNSREDVFSIEYSVMDGSSLGNINWGDLLNMPTTDACGGGGDGFLRPSQNLVNAYRVDENGLPLFDTFNDEDLSPTDPGNDPKPVDPRLDLVVTRVGIPWKGFHLTPEGRASAAPFPDASWMRSNAVYGLYARKKLIVPPDSPYKVDGFPWCGSSLNFPVIRYAEVLLWRAEALVESGSNLDEARQLVNQVRERAANEASWVRNADDTGFAANYQIGLYPADRWTSDYAREAIRFESRLETALEGHRFFNLVRWDTAEEVLTRYYREETDNAGYYSSAIFTPGKHEYLPIPQNQIDISEGLYDQNPGY